jgi:dephospho-CoA kinase
MPKSTQIIGVTGGVGSGKSTFARELAQLGCRLLDVDVVAWELTETHKEIRSALRATFGDAYFDSSGALKRRALGNLVFSNADELEKLNRIVFPVLLGTVHKQIQEWRESFVPLIGVVDMAILFEANVAEWCDRVVVVTASYENRKRRLAASRGWDEDEIVARIRSQLPVEEKIRRADEVVPNDGSVESLRKRAVEFYRALQAS